MIFGRTSEPPISTNSTVPMGDQLSPWSEDGRIMFIMFLYSGLCGGLTALVWAGWAVHQRRRRSGGKHSPLILALLVNDALELLLTPAAVIAVATAPCRNSLDNVLSVFLIARLGGLSLHQLVALEGTAWLTHPEGAAVLSSLPCALTLISSVLLPTTLAIVFSSNYNNLLMCVLLLAGPAGGAVSMFVLILSAKDPSDSKRPFLLPPRRGRAERLVMSVSLITFLGLYCPYFLTIAVSSTRFSVLPLWSGRHTMWETTCCSLMSLRLVTDPLLCMLVCRLAKP
ncbi:uncharacterized protein LOC134059618 [Sardina pilchardus]|uniref:uncharacterized protein LOC134059618 n=1 Tax=Sardina pilchardus TaxID=27697 RepID=UPI002E0F3293